MQTALAGAELGRHTPITVDAVAFRSAMRNVAAACTIVATGDTANPTGLTATSVCSLTAEPPRLVVCINRATSAHDAIERNGKLSVNVLAKVHEDLAKRFAGMVPDAIGTRRFEAGDWRLGKTGVIVLNEALASFECIVSDVFRASTHTLFVSDVVSVSTGSEAGTSLIYFDGRFAELAGPSRPL